MIINRYFQTPIHNNLVEIVIKRVKYMLNYPELIGHHRYQPAILSSNIKSETSSLKLTSAYNLDSSITYRYIYFILLS